MDNANQPPGPPPRDPSSTQPFRFTPGWPGGAEGYGPPRWDPQQPGGPGPRQPGGQGPQSAGGPGPQGRPGKSGRLLRWAGGIAAVALLAAGGTLAGLKLAASPASAAPANSASAMALNGALGSSAASGLAGCRLAASGTPAGSTSAGGTSAGGTSAGSRARAGRCRHLRLLHLVTGMYGQVAFHGPNGTVTFAFERGRVQSSSGGHLVVRAVSGTTWTWNLTSNSVIRSGGKHLPASALSGGSWVFVAGQVSGTSKDARLVIIRAANGSSPRNSSSQSPARSSAA